MQKAYFIITTYFPIVMQMRHFRFLFLEGSFRRLFFMVYVQSIIVLTVSIFILADCLFFCHFSYNDGKIYAREKIENISAGYWYAKRKEHFCIGAVPVF